MRTVLDPQRVPPHGPAIVPREWHTVVCVASGPSLTTGQIDIIASARESGLARVIVVNDNWRMMPQADVLYAADAKWWNHHADALLPTFRGELWTQDWRTHCEFRKRGIAMHWIKAKGYPGLSRDPALIHTGMNSGYQAINLAYHFGARVILLVGYDMQRTYNKAHWFGDHPFTGQASEPQKAFVPHFTALAFDLFTEGVRVYNCSIETALICFRRAQLSRPGADDILGVPRLFERPSGGTAPATDDTPGTPVAMEIAGWHPRATERLS